MKAKIFTLILIVFAATACKKEVIDPSPDIPAQNITPRPVSSEAKIDFTKSNTTLVFGDSWTDYRFDANNYLKEFADSSGQYIINTAAIGLGGANMVLKAFQNMPEVHNNTNILTLCGFNDVRFRGATKELINFEKNAYRILLANQFIDTWQPGGDPNRFGGSFVSFDKSLSGHFKSYYSKTKKAAYTQSKNGVYLEYDFTGSHIGVSFVGQDTTATGLLAAPYGRWRVLIDGVVIDTPSIHQQTQGHTPGYMASQVNFPFIKIYAGLEQGKHVLRLEPIDNGVKYIDFVFTLRSPALVSPVTIMKVPYMTQEGYKIDPFASMANDPAVDAVNKAITEVRNEFIGVDPGFAKRIKLINTCDFFDRTTDYRPDLIHPNLSGKKNLYESLKHHIIF